MQSVKITLHVAILPVLVLLLARHWYLQAAEQGDRNGQYNLGASYQRGDGATADIKQAIS